MNDRFYVSSMGKLAKVLGTSARTIERWSAERDVPGREGPGYDVAAWVAWRYGSNGQDTGEIETAADARRRYEAARATREEIKLARERGEVVDRAEADAIRAQLVRWLASALDGLPFRVAPAIVGKRLTMDEAISALDVAVNEYREALITRGADDER